jgi:hypothetical protein
MTMMRISDELELTPEQVAERETLPLDELEELCRAREFAYNAEVKILHNIIEAIWVTPGARTLADVQAARDVQERTAANRAHGWFRQLYCGIHGVPLDITADTTTVIAQDLAEALRTIGVEGDADQQVVLRALEQSLTREVDEDVERLWENEGDESAQRHLCEVLLHTLTATAAQVRDILTAARTDLNCQLRSAFDATFDNS